MALAWVSAGTRAFTQARAAKLLVEDFTAKSRVLLIVGSEATEKAPVPELDHCDQPAGKLPKAVELKFSTSQGDADGAWRGSKVSSCGITRRGDVLLIGGLEVGQARGPAARNSTETQPGTENRGGYTLAGTRPTSPSSIPA